MIVEFFGPPGSGKTTLARALAAELASRGRNVDLRLSFRPGEETSALLPGIDERKSQPIRDVARRVARPVAELFASAGVVPAGALRGVYSSALVSMLPRDDMLSSFRLRQYLARLSASWLKASRNAGIVIFDQGFVQLISTLMLIRSETADDRIIAAMDIVPGPDLIVRLDAPSDEIERRLERRKKALGFVGRLFESTPCDVDDYVRASSCLDKLLRRLGRRVIAVGSGDETAMWNAVHRLEIEILNILGDAPIKALSTTDQAENSIAHAGT